MLLDEHENDRRFIYGQAYMTQNIERFDILDVYENETRQKILELLILKKSQGNSLRNICKELGIPLPTVLWHVGVLEEFELIVKQKINREIIYVSMDYIDDFDYELKRIELSFKSEKAKIFYDYLRSLEEGQVFTLHSVLSCTSWSTRTALRYFSKLLNYGIIERSDKGRGYKISSNYFNKIQGLEIT